MKLYVFITSVHSTYSADEVRDTNIITVGLISTCLRFVCDRLRIWCCVCVREREDVDSKPLMMNDSPNFHSYCGAYKMLGYTEIKLQILIAKPIKLK